MNPEPFFERESEERERREQEERDRRERANREFNERRDRERGAPPAQTYRDPYADALYGTQQNYYERQRERERGAPPPQTYRDPYAEAVHGTQQNYYERAQRQRPVEALIAIQQHPLKTANMAQLIIHRAHPNRIAAAWDPWMQSQREIGEKFNSPELGAAFVSHVEVAVEVLDAVQQLAADGLLITSAIFDKIAGENGLTSTPAEKRALADFIAANRRHEQHLNVLVRALTKLYVTEGQRMTRIFARITRGPTPAIIESHLKLHLYHLLMQATHLFESQDAEDKSNLAGILSHEREAIRWLDLDVKHMINFGREMADSAAY